MKKRYETGVTLVSYLFDLLEVTVLQAWLFTLLFGAMPFCLQETNICFCCLGSH